MTLRSSRWTVAIRAEFGILESSMNSSSSAKLLTSLVPPGDFIILNHSASNWTPGSGSRKVPQLSRRKGHR